MGLGHLAEFLPYALAEFFFIASADGSVTEVQIPISFAANCAVLINDVVTRRHFPDISIDGIGSRDKVVTQIVAQGMGIKPPLYRGKL
jgi:hypothetical protein